MKKGILAVILIISAVFCAFGQNSGPIDLVLLLDTSSAMNSSYEKVNDYITGAFLSEFLRTGDTFHLITFSASPRLDIARRVSARGDIETIIGRMMIQYPVENGNDAKAAVSYAETYISSLPPRPKKIVMVSAGGSDTNNVVSAAKQRLGSKNATLDFVSVTGGQPLANLPSSGRPVASNSQQRPSSSGTASTGTSGSAAPPAAVTPSTPAAQGTSQTNAQSTAQGASQTGAQSTAQGASQTGAKPTTQSTPQTNAQSTAQGTSQTGAQSTAQGASQTGAKPATQSTPQTNAQSTAQGASQTGAQSTAQGASQTGAKSTTQSTPQTNAQSTTQGASQTGAQSTAQGASQTGAKPATQSTPQTNAQSTAQGASQTGTQSTAQGASQTGVQSTTQKNTDVQDTSAVNTNTTGTGSSAQGVSPSGGGKPASEQNNDFSGPDASAAKAASKKQNDSNASFNPTLLLIIGIIAAILLLTLLLIFASRRLRSSPNRVMASASAPKQKAETKVTKETKFTDHSKDLANYAVNQNKKRVTPYSNKPVKEQVVKQPVINPTDPVLINLFVEDQSTSIGKRNIHSLKSGYRLSVGGGKSDDFLIFLVPMPSNLGEISRSGSQITFTPHKPKYFPDIGSNEVRDCINKRIRVISEKNYEMWFSFVIYEDPLMALNQVLHSIKVPG